MQVQHTPQSNTPRFGSLVPTQFLQAALNKAPGIQKPLGKLLNMRESPSGNMHTQFIQDTAILWAPKAAVSRSWIELFESTFMELIESGCFYYFAPFTASLAVWPMMHKFAKSPFPKQYLATPLKQIPKHAAKAVMPVKLGIIATTVGLSATFLYALSFAKNLITEHKFKKTVFSDVVGLSKGQAEKIKGRHSKVTRKAVRRIIQSAIASAAIVAGGFMLARHGHKLPNFNMKKAVSNIPLLRRIAHKFPENTMESATHWLDFDFKAVRDKATGKIKMYKFDMGRNHLKVIMPFDILAYNDATRDKLEFIEVFSRTMITANYMAYFQPYFEQGWYKWAGKPYRYLGIFEGAKFNSMKKLEDISEMCINMAKDKLGANGVKATESAIKKEANKLFAERLAVKNKLFFGPWLFGIFGIGMFTAVMGQIWTRYRFEMAQKIQQRRRHLAEVQKNPAVQPLAQQQLNKTNAVEPPRFYALQPQQSPFVNPPMTYPVNSANVMQQS